MKKMCCYFYHTCESLLTYVDMKCSVYLNAFQPHKETALTLTPSSKACLFPESSYKVPVSKTCCHPNSVRSYPYQQYAPLERITVPQADFCFTHIACLHSLTVLYINNC